ncbi:2-oxo-4-hydroxy-4-carboxy-5-ureidoimidazoline decarboxylase [Mycobacterium sp. GA-1285]|uniref:2-oxo-4-hydroxy-4-carboxy-5-ureidoimidazoline decarboxylase n=1 Tax=Mycobacterium sp. GA-1285 TaxID=1772282 RepID=UPI00155FB0B0|nr:2-oxo-4-hydroxy-4-carboxy-5-ureidoimidazoline decarboxylase [Mycobacterium sp. GA-1285]
MLMHQGIGLEAFNAMPMRRAVHAVYECCCCVPLAAELARGRPYPDHESLFREADALLFSLGEESIDTILQAYPDIGRRPGLAGTAQRYREHFGFGFVMFVNGVDDDQVLATMSDRMHNDAETERKIMRNELARINRARLQRMLGPEGGYDNW